MNVRLLNFLLSTCFVLVVGFSYFIDSYVVLTVVAVLMGSLAGQINVCNVSLHFDWIVMFDNNSIESYEIVT